MHKYLILFFILVFIPLNIYGITLEKCMDGDTFKLKDNEKIITVRLLAVDTPELKKTDELSYLARDYTCDLLTNAQKITIETDPKADQDRYGRQLLWVYTDNKLIQQSLVEKGYASIAYLYDDYLYTNQLYPVEAKARKFKLGIWQDSNQELDILLTILVILMVILSILKTIKKMT